MTFEDTLAQVKWEELEECYGPATTVPDMLRGLAHPDEDWREECSGDLCGGSVMHQGTRYSVTPHVIPCLVDLIAEKGLPDRAEVLRCLGWLIGYMNDYVESGGDVEDAPYPPAPHRSA